MATITLTITDEMLERLRAGETTLTLVATLKEKKPRGKTEPLPEHLREAYDAVVGMWAHHQPSVSPALAWKTIRPMVEASEDVSLLLESLALWLDWNSGRRVMPLWFTKDYGPSWEEVVHMDLFAQEERRANYRKRLGLT